MSEETLIDAIKRHEVLYNQKCEDYRDSDKRQVAWEEVSRLYGKTLRESKEDWHKLRNCYNNAVKRRQNTKGKHMAPWRLEEKMSFLKQDNEPLYQTTDYYMKTRIIKSENMSEDESTEGADYADSPASSEDTQTSKISQTNNNHFDNSTSNKRKANPFNMSIKIESSKEIETAHEANLNNMSIEIENSKEIETAHAQQQRNDEFDDTDHFFLSMSKMVKKLPKIDQIHIKLNLHKAINKVELSLLNENG